MRLPSVVRVLEPVKFEGLQGLFIVLSVANYVILMNFAHVNKFMYIFRS